MDNLIKKEFDGVMVSFHGKQEVSLTDLWRASGRDKNFQPDSWFRESTTSEFLLAMMEDVPECQTFREQVLKNKPCGANESENLKKWSNEITQKAKEAGFISSKRGGKNPGTWANQIIAVSYAGYLSPKLQIWVNRTFLERLEENKNPDLIGARFIKTYENQGLTSRRIKLRFDSIQSNKAFNEILSRHGVDGRGHGMCSGNINVGILGVQKKTYLRTWGFEPTAILRDVIPDTHLAGISLAEVLTSERIEKENINGNHDCCKVAYEVAKGVGGMIDSILMKEAV